MNQKCTCFINILNQKHTEKNNKIPVSWNPFCSKFIWPIYKLIVVTLPHCQAYKDRKLILSRIEFTLSVRPSTTVPVSHAAPGVIAHPCFKASLLCDRKVAHVVSPHVVFHIKGTKDGCSYCHTVHRFLKSSFNVQRWEFPSSGSLLIALIIPKSW